MQVFLECKPALIAKKDFTNRESGEVRTRYQTYLQDENGDMIVVNSKFDVTKHKDRQGVAKLGVFERNEGPGFYLTLLEFVPQEEVIE